MALLTAACCELLSWGPSVMWLRELLLGAWLSPLFPCLCLLERKGSFININVNRAHVELDVSEHPVATSGSQTPSREFSRAKSQLASFPLAWKHGVSRCVQKVIFWSWYQCWKAARAMASAQQGTLFGFSPSLGKNFPITSPKFVWASTVSSVKVQRVWAAGKCFCLALCSSSACFHYLYKAGDRFFFSKLDPLVSQSRGAVYVRAGGGQDKHFRERPS